jgi:predicted GNAT family acetyltransferase
MLADAQTERLLPAARTGTPAGATSPGAVPAPPPRRSIGSEAAVDGALAGYSEYRQKPGLMAFVHTEVDQAFEGHGVASILIHDALEDARRRGLAVLPFCPFVNAYIEQHREYVELVPESQREAFGL